MPPEWAPHEAVWLSWPVDDPRHWGGAKRDTIHAKFAELAAVISRFTPVRINANPGTEDAIHRLCRAAGAESVECFPHPHDDVWCRDHGPLFLRDQRGGGIAVSDWGFNAWGGKFAPWDEDDRIPRRIAESLGLPRVEGGMILEGGAIELSGDGTLLTTEAVLLNPNRNPAMSRDEIEARLREVLGVRRILWLEHGIAGDDTDGHIDDLARFVDEATILACVDPDPASPNHAVLAANLGRLRGFETAAGRPYELVEMPMPDPCAIPGWRLPLLPASYVNFLVTNAGVVAPTFRQAENDDRALGILREVFPRHEVVGIDCLDLVEEGGSIHCLTQQQPAAGPFT